MRSVRIEGARATLVVHRLQQQLAQSRRMFNFSLQTYLGWIAGALLVADEHYGARQ